MKRIIAMLLTLLMLLPTFVACANDSDGEGSNPAGSQSGSGPAESDSPYLDTGLPVIDFDGKAFRFYSRGQLADATIDTYAPDIVADGLNTDPLNNAVYERNVILEDLYKIKFVNYQFDEPYKDVQKAIKSDLDPCEIVTDAIGDLAGLVVENSLYELESFSKYTRYTESWWDQNCRTQTVIKNKLFFMCGAITMMDNKATWACAFNKDIVANNDALESPYDLVDSNRWTYDTFYKMMEEATVDLDANDTMDESDQWGLLTETFNTYALFAGSGAYIIKTDETGIPYYALLENERNFDALRRAATINTDKNFSITGSGNTNASDKRSQGIFYNGRALFMIASMGVIEWMRPYEADFGIIPLPKLEGGQKNYHSSITPYHYCVYSVPSSVVEKDLEFVDLILENLAVYSKEMVEPAYIDKVLVGKGLRDKESEPMLKIIFDNCMFDLGALYNFGSVYGFCEQVNARRVESVISRLKTLEGSTKRDINKFIDFLDRNFK